ncbi:HepT-like ribonuclease domain-containing protein [Fuchsiella alkaliacetigena]|uniref:HepT-like ribonuclease domain-containing protein n=1 Tax=Fuchsiella alkaliacetigena TaxID=957042 RepID=UPI00200A4F4C|nr:HepT-like ribonuclease domain-containing protein [Fuchsiella alkaliacetigena]MCK8824957.1 DUF86 domain-containing protein [Fuchsiella alkaliacetigena]
MSTNFQTHINDIFKAIVKIEKYTKNLSYDEFKEDELIQDGTIRNLRIISKTVHKISDEIKEKNPQVKWKKIAEAESFLNNNLAEMDLKKVWEIIETKLPNFKQQIIKVNFNLNIDQTKLKPRTIPTFKNN